MPGIVSNSENFKPLPVPTVSTDFHHYTLPTMFSLILQQLFCNFLGTNFWTNFIFFCSCFFFNDKFNNELYSPRFKSVVFCQRCFNNENFKPPQIKVQTLTAIDLTSHFITWSNLSDNCRVQSQYSIKHINTTILKTTNCDSSSEL